MRRRHIVLGALTLAVVVAAIGGVAYVLHTRAQSKADAKSYPGLYGPVAVVCPRSPAGTTGQGDPSNANQGLFSIRPRNDCTPSFTQQDVRDYVAHGGRLGTLTVTGQPIVTRVVFLTVADLNRVGRLSFPSKYPPDMLVCYVELSGTFSIPNLDVPNTESVVSFVLDAHTGNQLVFIGGPLLG